jgi:hypothetical protein
MQPREVWQEDPVFIEIGVKDAELAQSLRGEGYSKYLGVDGSDQRIADIQTKHPDLAEDFTCAKHRKQVRRNNAEVLILSGFAPLHLWKYRSVRHARYVTWRMSFNPLSIIALFGCLLHMMSQRYSMPQIVTLHGPGGKVQRLFVTRILRRKLPGQQSLHFIPHRPGLSGFFQLCDKRNVRYVVMRWFESLPNIGPDEDVDLLVADSSLDDVIDILNSRPGIQPCDLYSENGLARSNYCGTPYYPASVASRILSGAKRHDTLCMVPNQTDYFHSLAYHAVYHKGLKSNLTIDESGARSEVKSGHDFVGILQTMADGLGIEVDITLEGLHAYLQNSGWGPSPEMLARLAVACRRNKWLQILNERLESHVHDQGLAVFVIRQEAVLRDYTDLIIDMIEEGGFEILASRMMPPEAIEFGAAQTRGGNWTLDGPFDLSGGPPAAVVVAYDHDPQPLNKQQRRKFRTRTNARIFVKEQIRDVICDDLPSGHHFNAFHSSDYAADAWHLVEVLSPELTELVRNRLCGTAETAATSGELRRAA